MAIARLEQLVGKLTREGIPHVVIPRDDGSAILEVGRFGYFFNKNGRADGGYVFLCVEYRRDWLGWAQLLGFTMRFDDAE